MKNSQTAKTRIGFCLLGLLTVFALGTWQIFTGDTIVRQKTNMDRARLHVSIVREKLDLSKEFRHLRALEFTGAGGSLLIEGIVPTEADVDRVKGIVEQTKPPVDVVYQVRAASPSR